MTSPILRYAPLYLAVILVAGGAGVLLAWWMRRYTTVSIRNVYFAAFVAAALDAWVLQARAANALIVMAPITSFLLAASAVGRRWRLSDLGAGEELRAHERARRWLWQPPPERTKGERVHIVTQGQIVRERRWPASEPYVPMTADETAGPRVPRRSGRHIFCAGATGSGKTTSALRAAAGRVLKDHSALFFVDQKGDPHAEAFLRNLAAAMDVPFILFDPRADDSDHWQPLWGERPAEVVARVLAGIQTSEPYYADVPRKHVGIVATVLHIAGYWPPSFPLLVEASQLTRFDRVQALAAQRKDAHPELWRRVQTHARFVAGSEGHRALAGGLTRLDLVIGEAWRRVLTPRCDPAGQPVGVSLTNAITERAVVLWRTHVDLMPDEAKTITAVILNDIHASAVEAQADGPARWTCVLDEFGAVVATAADQALALLQRGRTHEGQVLVVTQSVADIEALTGQPGLLASMADNFAGFIVHRQSAPESRDWLAKLMGTTALWQSTDQTSGHAATGAGSRRRVREFRISSDTFSELRVGEAVIHTTLGPPPTTCRVQPLHLRTDRSPPRIDTAERIVCEICVHPAAQLPIAARTDDGATLAARPCVPTADDPGGLTAPERPTTHTATRSHVTSAGRWFASEAGAEFRGRLSAARNVDAKAQLVGIAGLRL